MSAHHFWFPAVAVKSRSTRSGAGRTPSTRIVVRRRLRGACPEISAASISRSTRLRATRIPSRRSLAWTRREP
jgi:hypothetical protein